jgi:hypothetical protein
LNSRGLVTRKEATKSANGGYSFIWLWGPHAGTWRGELMSRHRDTDKNSYTSLSNAPHLFPGDFFWQVVNRRLLVPLRSEKTEACSTV